MMTCPSVRSAKSWLGFARCMTLVTALALSGTTWAEEAAPAPAAVGPEAVPAEPKPADANPVEGAPDAKEEGAAASTGAGQAGEFGVYVRKIEGVLAAFDGAARASLMIGGVSIALGLLLMFLWAGLAPGNALLQWFVVLLVIVGVQQVGLFYLTNRAITDQAKELMLDDKQTIGVRVYSLEHSPYFDRAYREQQLRQAAREAADKLPLVERFNRLAEDYQNHDWYLLWSLKYGGATLLGAVLTLGMATLISQRQLQRS